MMGANKIVSKMFRANTSNILKKGEMSELQKGLVSQYANERIEAIKKTIAAMTVGKDVSSLFPDVLKNVATRDLTLKKLVYLYLMNYAKTHPDLCILAVNTFVKDSEEYNPTIRALAIRTMGCIRVDKILSYLADPLRKALTDEHPYVRKTAAVCVAKVYDIDPKFCVANDFLKLLTDLIDDANPIVVANAVTALIEIHDTSIEKNVFFVNAEMADRLLVALNECTEWGRISILNALSRFETDNIKTLEHICERVIPQLQHANSAVVLASVKVIMPHIDRFEKSFNEMLYKKMAPPLLSLMSAEPEVQYVALRNIILILQKNPNIFDPTTRVFFCKFNDPLYVKLEKLRVLTMLACEENVSEILLEVKSYVAEVEMEFVKKAIACIGEISIKVPSSVETCVSILVDLYATNSSYVMQEATVVSEVILRTYPQMQSSLLPFIVTVFDDLDDPRARASIAWILGEFCTEVANAGTLLSSMVDVIDEEETQVQLAVLTAVVKLAVLEPSGQQLLQKMIQFALERNENQDLRDRAIIYQRFLQQSESGLRKIMLNPKPALSYQTDVPPALLDSLLSEITTLASVYHKRPESFIGYGKFGAEAIQRKAVEELASEEEATKTAITTGENVENLLDIDFSSSTATPTPTSQPSTHAMDLFKAFEASPNPTSSTSSPAPSAPSESSSHIRDILDL
ncbi:AP-1 adaptor complex subunit beta subunit Apl2 [Schizosaccharomyces japonicus yFS275]|uniref:AP complex subunit beta n=1 Tax=Schizosaccharomyces japonicus (strain yFS275 / FY16936) TaxID=402676 RepID=B6K759_SCHJY|nr:AP-1 adaptor complex subunit beta subunit Apl2 [Schizosaccharomyces japonicus yFS275]EEB09363.1 AP-1 adaptor complex subunit beta subunit Apl2 [Schizosaccharomyces japonicus yFS275]